MNMSNAGGRRIQRGATGLAALIAAGAAMVLAAHYLPDRPPPVTGYSILDMDRALRAAMDGLLAILVPSAVSASFALLALVLVVRGAAWCLEAATGKVGK